MTSSWGYGYSAYYNPYYTVPVATQVVPYDYSQPVVVNNYVSTDVETPGRQTEVPPSTPQQEQALSSFDQGLAEFKAGQYVASLSDFNAALKELPGDVVVHEVRALALFATGDYQTAAASLNSLLSSAPGMDWTTMSGLYGNPDDYTAQLRKLEQFCKANQSSAPAYFVLAYHYLVVGAKDGAIKALKVVVANQPKDLTAKRMLDAMLPPDQPAKVAPTPANTTLANTDAPQTDLVGKWLAKSGDTSIELSVSEDSQFTWKAIVKDQSPVVLNGQLTTASDEIALETQEQGTMGGKVVSNGPDNWTFAISGAPPSDPGLNFSRVE